MNPLQIEFKENISFNVVVFENTNMKLKVNNKMQQNILFFTNNDCLQITIPKDLFVYEIETNEKIEPTKEIFILKQNSNYIVKLKNKTLLEMKNKQVFELSSPDRDIEVI